MAIKKLGKKAQGLPLNTIVIAILVIIVLLVIVVFFTTNIGKQGKTLGETTKGVTDNCDRTNPILSNYGKDKIIQDTNSEGKCSDESKFSKVPGLNCCVSK